MGDFSNKSIIRSDEKTICEYQSLFFKLVKPTESSESTDCVDTAWDAPNKTDDTAPPSTLPPKPSTGGGKQGKPSLVATPVSSVKTS